MVLSGCAEKAADVARTSQRAPSGTSSSIPAGPPVLQTLTRAISTDEVVVMTRNNDIVSVTEDGRTIRSLGHLPAAVGDEADSLDVSPDGRHVVLSVVNDHDSTCAATVFSVGQDQRLHRLVDGGVASFSPDGRRLAYLRYAREGGFCFRTQLVVRQLATGSEIAVALPGGRAMEGNPPEWPLNWSPDGTKLAYVAAKRGASVTTIGEWRVAAVGPAATGTPPLAPVFLDSATVAAMTNCCSGTDQRMTMFSLAARHSTKLFTVPGPVRGIRRDRGGNGLWLTVEEPGDLWHWDGRELRSVPVSAVMTSG